MTYKIIKALNKLRSSELHAILQYMNQRYAIEEHCKKTAKMFKEIAIDEMHHAELLAKRIESFGGIPTTLVDTHIQPYETILEAAKYNIRLEQHGLNSYNDALALCKKHGDHETEIILTKIIEREKLHVMKFEQLVYMEVGE